MEVVVGGIGITLVRPSKSFHPRSMFMREYIGVRPSTCALVVRGAWILLLPARLCSLEVQRVLWPVVVRDLCLIVGVNVIQRHVIASAFSG